MITASLCLHFRHSVVHFQPPRGRETHTIQSHPHTLTIGGTTIGTSLSPVSETHLHFLICLVDISVQHEIASDSDGCFTDWYFIQQWLSRWSCICGQCKKYYCDHSCLRSACCLFVPLCLFFVAYTARPTHLTVSHTDTAPILRVSICFTPHTSLLSLNSICVLYHLKKNQILNWNSRDMFHHISLFATPLRSAIYSRSKGVKSENSSALPIRWRPATPPR